MLTASPEYFIKLASPIIKWFTEVKVNFTDAFLDPTISGSSTDNNYISYPNQMVNGRTVMTHKWSELDGQMNLDSSFKLCASTTESANFNEHGWWSATRSSATGVINTSAQIEYSSRKVSGVFISFDDKLNEYGVDYTIKFYNGVTLVHTVTETGGAVTEKQFTFTQISNIDKAVLNVTKWSQAETVVKVSEFTTQVVEIYTDEIACGWSVTEEREISNDGYIPTGAISSNQASVCLINGDGRPFDANNTASRLSGLVKPNALVEISLGLELNKGDNSFLIQNGVNDPYFSTHNYIDVNNSAGIYPSYENALRDAYGESNIVATDYTNGKFTINVPTGQTRSNFSLPSTTLLNGQSYDIYFTSTHDIQRLSIAQNDGGYVYPLNVFNIGTSYTGTITMLANVFSLCLIDIDANFDTDIEIEYTIVPKGYPKLQEWGGSQLTASLDSGVKSISFQLSDLTKASGAWGQFVNLTNANSKTRLNVFVSNTSNILDFNIYSDGGSFIETYRDNATSDEVIYTIVFSSVSVNVYRNNALGISTSTATISPLNTFIFSTTNNASCNITQLVTSTLESTGYPAGTTIPQTNAYTELEYQPMFKGWATEWDVPEASKQANTTARDRLNLLTQTNITTSVTKNNTFFTWFETVLNDAGLANTEYNIDTTLNGTNYNIPVMWFAGETHRKALEILAQACNSTVFVDRLGLVQIKKLDSFASGSVQTFTRSDYTNKDNQPAYQDVVNDVTVTTSPYIETTGVTVYETGSTDPENVSASSTETYTIRYNETPVSDITTLDVYPVISGVTVTGSTQYSWGASVQVTNTNGTAQDFQLRAIGSTYTVSGQKSVNGTDTESINDNGRVAFTYPTNRALQDKALANDIKTELLASFKDAQRDLSLEFSHNGNPLVELGDEITVTDLYTSKVYKVISQNMTYDHRHFSMTRKGRV